MRNFWFHFTVVLFHSGCSLANLSRTHIYLFSLRIQIKRMLPSGESSIPLPLAGYQPTIGQHPFPSTYRWDLNLAYLGYLILTITLNNAKPYIQSINWITWCIEMINFTNTYNIMTILLEDLNHPQQKKIMNKTLITPSPEVLASIKIHHSTAKHEVCPSWVVQITCLGEYEIFL